ncbi:hypothetical protein HMPREF9153_0955 [Cutibacterium avidum ATCC 25577]|uniref:Uncharacterized protein n=1 Tax=Cutibacterium avidum ATCC 25577 TaxID=997355 RepID=G4CWP8_9ACTN|nr:hypothetical protein HMPREF9153_0955 [Cutibacterium avidum ATCC 25577]
MLEVVDALVEIGCHPEDLGVHGAPYSAPTTIRLLTIGLIAFEGSSVHRRAL